MGCNISANIFCLIKSIVYICINGITLNMEGYTIKKVEKCVCEYFEVDYDDTMVVKSKKHKCSLARSFIVCILHNEYKLSQSFLSNYYKYSDRTIRRMCADVKSLCKIYKEYKKHYGVLTTVLLDLDFA